MYHAHIPMSIEISSFLEEFLKKLRVLNCVPAFDCESDVFAAFLVAKFDKIGHIQRATAEGVVLVTRAVVVMEVDMSYPLTHNRDPVLYRHFLCHAVGMSLPTLSIISVSICGSSSKTFSI